MDNIDIKLVIRAPNQNVDDQTIECQMEWTVEKLKNHLCEVYPNNPEPKEQKIIYSGRLLRDHLQLKDILRYEDKTSVQILHLVCSRQTRAFEDDYSLRSSQTFVQTSDSEGFSDDSEDQDYSDSSQRSQSRTSTPADEFVSSDNMPGTSQPAQSNQDAYSQVQYMSQMYMNYLAQQGLSSGVYSTAQSPDITAQMAAFQNIYSSYYYQYMQNLQMFSGLPAAHNTVNMGEITMQTPAAAAHNPPNNNNNRNVQVNAAQGAVQALDEDNDQANRDWLDYFYLCCRGFVLFSIVYFYSSPERLVLVIGLAFLALLYQEGWILARVRNDRIHDNRQRARQRENRPAENRNNTDDEASAHSQNEDADRERQNVNEIEAIMDGDDPPHAQNHPNVPTHHSPAWTFISSFFSSLIPEPPAPVNIN